MLLGLDYLGGANYGDLITREHPEGWAAGFMLNVNDPKWPKMDCWPIIESLASSGRCPLIRVHAVWEDNHTYSSRKHDATIEGEFLRTEAMAKRFPGVRFQFSWMCEHNMTAAQIRPIVQKYQGRGVELVNSIWKGQVVPGVKTEVHGPSNVPRGGKHNYSFDGDHCVDMNVEAVKRKHRDADVFFFWVVQCNGRYNNKPRNLPDADNTPRNKRKAWLYEKLMDSMIFLGTTAGDVSLKGNQIWKTHADQHGPKPDSRANKPVLISPHSGARAELVASNGQVVAIGASAGVFNDGSRRTLYRFPEFGYELANKAIRIHGSPVVRIRIGGRFVGRINPGFRAGSFR